MTPKRALTLLVVLSATACGEPFTPEPTSDGPPLGALRINVAMLGNGTFDYDGFLATSPFFELPFGYYGGSLVSPDLPEGLNVTVGFERLAEWCPAAPQVRRAKIVRNDTIDLDFSITCRTLYRPVRFYASVQPDTTPPFSVFVRIGELTAFSLSTGQSRLDTIPVNDWPVSTTLPPACHRSPDDKSILHVDLYPSDTIRYYIHAICAP